MSGKTGVHTVDTLTYMPISKLEPSPWNIRKSRSVQFDESIKEHGIQQPIKVRPVGEKMQIIFGDGRYDAAKSLGIKVVPVIVHPCSDDEALELHGVENLCRNNWLPVEEGEFFAEMRKRGHSLRQMEKTYNVSRGQISERINLFELLDRLSPEAKKAVSRGDVATSTVEYVLDKLPEKESLETIELAAKNRMNLEATMEYVSTLPAALELQRKAESLPSHAVPIPVPKEVEASDSMFGRVREYPIEGTIQSVSIGEREVWIKAKNGNSVDLISEFLQGLKRNGKAGDWIRITVRIEGPFKHPTRKQAEAQEALVDDFNWKMKMK